MRFLKRQRLSPNRMEVLREFLAAAMMATALSLGLPWVKTLTSISKLLGGSFRGILTRLRSGEEHEEVWIEEAWKVGFHRWLDAKTLTSGSRVVAREVLKDLQEKLVGLVKERFERMKLLTLIAAASAFIAPIPLIMGLMIMVKAQMLYSSVLLVHIAALVLAVKAVLRRGT